MHPLINRFKAFFTQRPAKLIGQKLYAACVDQSRQVLFYTDYGIVDEIGARFELLTFHVGVVVTQLRSIAADDPRHEQAQDTAQALFDAFLLALDSTLREQGTGDLTVPKKMKKLGIVVYTRMKRWDDLWREGASLTDQADYAARTIYAGSDYEAPESSDSSEDTTDNQVSTEVLALATAFTTYVTEARAALTIEPVLTGQLNWLCPAPLSALADA